ncbi:MAG: PKD-like family lipoprotein, partial [Odoribacter sp.]
MKKISLLSILFVAGIFSACYDDLGNYGYHEINEIEVDSIRSSYNCDTDDSLCIYPIIKGTEYSDTSRFSYEWEIGSEKVATTHDLNIIINMLPGYKFARYIVKDKETKVKKYYTFNVNVSSSTAGDLLMILSKYQGQAELSYLRLDKEANWAVNYYQERFNEALGTNPQQLSICYTQMSKPYPFVTNYGRIMVLADDQIRLIDKRTLMPDTITPYLTSEAYTGLASYPKPDISTYTPQFIEEVISGWRVQTLYNTTYYNNYIMEISNGRLYSAVLGSFGNRYSYDRKTVYDNGSLSPFGYWDDMSNSESYGTNKLLSYRAGDFILFDQINHRFLYGDAYGGLYKIGEEDVKAFPAYDKLLWGSATNSANNTSLAVLSNGTNCQLVLLQAGKDSKGNDTKKLVGDIAAGSVVNAQTKFYMLHYNENLFFVTGNKLYRYNILNINAGIAPGEKDVVLKLSDYGYDAEAMITSLCVSRSEKTLLLGVSRYGTDSEGAGEEAKGDILWFDLNATTLQVTYRENKSTKGVSGIPVEVKIKYQTHW